MDKDDVIDTLNDLIETCKDGEYGFRACAEHTQAADLKADLARHAEECQKGARELQTAVVKLGGKAQRWCRGEYKVRTYSMSRSRRATFTQSANWASMCRAMTRQPT